MAEMCENTEDADDLQEATIVKHRDFLIENIECEFGLLDDLRQNKTLSGKETEDIDRIISTYQKKTVLINAIIAKKLFSNFKKALKNNQQSHIVNYLLSDGKFKEEFGKEWPLKEREYNILTGNYTALVDLIEISELINKLLEEAVINKRQSEYIYSKPTPADGNKTLLEILKRKSLRDYWITIECLRSIKHGHLAKILVEGGETPRADFDVNGAEQHDIVERFKKMLIHCSPKERREIFQELKDLGLIGATTGHSISLYFHCVRSIEVHRLKTVAASGRLAVIVKEVVNRLYNSSTDKSVELKRVVLRGFCLIENTANEGGKLFEATHAVIEFVSRIDFEEYPHEVLGITKLKKKIYMRVRPTHSDISRRNCILVYEDRHPFGFLENIDLEEIHYPTDLASSESENCLYVNDQDTNCIWKITEETDKNQQRKYKTIKWLTLNFISLILSTTSDGRLLTMDDHPIYTLRIYGSDAILCSSFQFPGDTSCVAHAVTTSSGSILVLHTLRPESLNWAEAPWVISQFSEDGKMVIRRPIPQEPKISGRSFLAVDSKNRVLIADGDNHRLILLNSDLTWNRILIEKESNTGTYPFMKPRTLLYDEENETLFVGATNPGSGAAVYVYTLSIF